MSPVGERRTGSLRLLVTRPEPDAALTAAALAARGHDVVVEPMLRIAPIAAPIPQARYQAVVATSANAVRVLAARPESAGLRDLPFLAVGPATAAALGDSGFARVLVAEGDAASLGRLAAANLDPAAGPILYAAARDRAGRLDAALQAAGFAVTTVVLYQAEAATRLSGATQAALRDGGIHGALFYSGRTAEAFAACVRGAGLDAGLRGVTAFAISAAAAAPLAPLGFARVAVAPRPDGGSLLALIEDGAPQAATRLIGCGRDSV